MAISFVGSTSAAATSVTLPAHKAGDLLVVYAFRDGSNTAPSNASGWSNLNNGGANLVGGRLSVKWAQSNAETSGTWTNATGLILAVYRGVGGIGNDAAGNGTGSTITYPAVTLQNGDGTSWLSRFSGHASATNLTANTPAGYTARGGVNTEVRGMDTNGGVASGASVTQSVDATGGWRAASLELVAAKAIDTFTDDFATQDAVKWSGYDANTTATGGQLRIIPKTGYPGITSVKRFDLTSKAFVVELVQNANLGNGGISVEMGLRAGNDIVSMIVFAGFLTFRQVVNGTNSDQSVTYSATSHRWLRIRELGGTVYWDTSANGVAWVNRRSAALGISIGNVQANINAGYSGTEPSPGTAVLDNVNLVPTPLPSIAPGWYTGGMVPFGGGIDSGSPPVPTRNYYDLADWMWNPIPSSPVLDSDSAAMVALLSAGSPEQRSANTVDYAAANLGPSGIDEATPRYTVVVDNYPDWGANPLEGMTVPIPNGVHVPPGTDGHLSIADPTTGKVYGLWQAYKSGSVWHCGWAAVSDLHGDGIETGSGSSTGAQLARYGLVIRATEIAAGEIPHALFFSSDMAANDVYRYPAHKTDGVNIDSVMTPIPEGARVQLDPSIDLVAISGITPAELAIGRVLQKYGAYCGDNGGSRMAFPFEYVWTASGDPGPDYVAAGLEWDYYDMTHIPWSSLRVLKNWDGSV